MKNFGTLVVTRNNFPHRIDDRLSQFPQLTVNPFHPNKTNKQKRIKKRRKKEGNMNGKTADCCVTLHCGGSACVCVCVTSCCVPPILGSSIKFTVNLSKTNITGSLLNPSTTSTSSSKLPLGPIPSPETLNPNNPAIAPIVPTNCLVCKHITTKFTLKISQNDFWGSRGNSGPSCGGRRAAAMVVRMVKEERIVG
jgi:hypothetical protein